MIHTNTEPLCYTPKTNIMLYVNYSQLKKKRFPICPSRNIFMDIPSCDVPSTHTHPLDFIKPKNERHLQKFYYIYNRERTTRPINYVPRFLYLGIFICIEKAYLGLFRYGLNYVALFSIYAKRKNRSK